MTSRVAFIFGLLLGCGGMTGADDASVDASTNEAASDSAACTPYVTAWDGGLGVSCDGGCTTGLGTDGLNGTYGFCTRSCSDLDFCPKGFVCDIPVQGAHEFDCFPECDDAGTCPSPLTCAGYTTPLACH